MDGPPGTPRLLLFSADVELTRALAVEARLAGLGFEAVSDAAPCAARLDRPPAPAWLIVDFAAAPAAAEALAGRAAQVLPVWLWAPALDPVDAASLRLRGLTLVGTRRALAALCRRWGARSAA
ncbi:MAG: hypothetical protein KatS3mg121_0702 [Gammaproteobacteria bacterium]|nr:MAG: hypothetical protein KatS3mg121_0702 [Gammaproteobacteria bacterium]